MNDADYVYNESSLNKIDGKRIEHEELLLDGSKFFIFKYFHKETVGEEKTTVKYVGNKDMSADTYNFKYIKDGAEPKEETGLTLDELKKRIQKIKELGFVTTYLNNKSGGAIRKKSKVVKKRLSKKKPVRRGSAKQKRSADSANSFEMW